MKINLGWIIAVATLGVFSLRWTVDAAEPVPAYGSAEQADSEAWPCPPNYAGGGRESGQTPVVLVYSDYASTAPEADNDMGVRLTQNLYEFEAW